jgi:hypothetical protein
MMLQPISMGLLEAVLDEAAAKASGDDDDCADDAGDDTAVVAAATTDGDLSAELRALDLVDKLALFRHAHFESGLLAFTVQQQADKMENVRGQIAEMLAMGRSTVVVTDEMFTATTAKLHLHADWAVAGIDHTIPNFDFRSTAGLRNFVTRDIEPLKLACCLQVQEADRAALAAAAGCNTLLLDPMERLHRSNGHRLDSASAREHDEDADRHFAKALEVLSNAAARHRVEPDDRKTVHRNMLKERYAAQAIVVRDQHRQWQEQADARKTILNEQYQRWTSTNVAAATMGLGGGGNGTATNTPAAHIENDPHTGKPAAAIPEFDFEDARQKCSATKDNLVDYALLMMRMALIKRYCRDLAQDFKCNAILCQLGPLLHNIYQQCVGRRDGAHAALRPFSYNDGGRLEAKDATSASAPSMSQSSSSSALTTSVLTAGGGGGGGGQQAHAVQKLMDASKTCLDERGNIESPFHLVDTSVLFEKIKKAEDDELDGDLKDAEGGSKTAPQGQLGPAFWRKKELAEDMLTMLLLFLPMQDIINHVRIQAVLQSGTARAGARKSDVVAHEISHELQHTAVECELILTKPSLEYSRVNANAREAGGRNLSRRNRLLLEYMWAKRHATLARTKLVFHAFGDQLCGGSSSSTSPPGSGPQTGFSDDKMNAGLRSEHAREDAALLSAASKHAAQKQDIARRLKRDTLCAFLQAGRGTAAGTAATAGTGPGNPLAHTSVGRHMLHAAMLRSGSHLFDRSEFNAGADGQQSFVFQGVGLHPPPPVAASFGSLGPRSSHPLSLPLPGVAAVGCAYEVDDFVRYGLDEDERGKLVNTYMALDMQVESQRVFAPIVCKSSLHFSRQRELADRAATLQKNWHPDLHPVESPNASQAPPAMKASGLQQQQHTTAEVPPPVSLREIFSAGSAGPGKGGGGGHRHHHQKDVDQALKPLHDVVGGLRYLEGCLALSVGRRATLNLLAAEAEGSPSSSSSPPPLQWRREVLHSRRAPARRGKHTYYRRIVYRVSEMLMDSPFFQSVMVEAASSSALAPHDTQPVSPVQQQGLASADHLADSKVAPQIRVLDSFPDAIILVAESHAVEEEIQRMFLQSVLKQLQHTPEAAGHGFAEDADTVGRSRSIEQEAAQQMLVDIMRTAQRASPAGSTRSASGARADVGQDPKLVHICPRRLQAIIMNHARELESGRRRKLRHLHDAFADSMGQMSRLLKAKECDADDSKYKFRRAVKTAKERAYVRATDETFHIILELEDAYRHLAGVQAQFDEQRAVVHQEVKREYEDKIRDLSLEIIAVRSHSQEYRESLQQDMKNHLSQLKKEAMAKMVDTGTAPMALKTQMLKMKKEEETKQQMQAENALIKNSLLKLKTMHEMQDEINKAAYEKKIREQKLRLSQSLELWEDKAGMERQSTAKANEVLHLQYKLKFFEGRVEELQRQLNTESKARASLLTFKVKHNREFENLKLDLKKFEKLSNVDVDKLLMDLNNKDKQIQHLSNLEDRSAKQNEMMGRTKDKDLKKMKQLLQHEKKLKNEAFAKVQELRVEMEEHRQLAGEGHADEWKVRYQHCLTSYNGVIEENHTLRKRFEEMGADVPLLLAASNAQRSRTASPASPSRRPKSAGASSWSQHQPSRPFHSSRTPPPIHFGVSHSTHSTMHMSEPPMSAKKHSYHAPSTRAASPSSRKTMSARLPRKVQVPPHGLMVATGMGNQSPTSIDGPRTVR